MLHYCFNPSYRNIKAFLENIASGSELYRCINIIIAKMKKWHWIIIEFLNVMYPKPFFFCKKYCGKPTDQNLSEFLIFFLQRVSNDCEICKVPMRSDVLWLPTRFIITQSCKHTCTIDPLMTVHNVRNYFSIGVTCLRKSYLKT